MEIGPVRRQSLIVFGSSIGVTVIGFFATIYIAHVAGAAALGGLYLLLAYTGIIGLFTDGGVGSAAVQRISEGTEQDGYFSAHAAIRTVLLVVTVTLLFAARPLFVDLDQAGLFPWMIVILVVSAASGIVSTGVYASGKVGILQVADFLNNLVRILVQVLAVSMGYSVAGLAGGIAAGLAAGLVVNIKFLHLHLTRFERPHIRGLFAFSGYSFVIGLTATLMGYADTILIGYFLSNTEVGLYRTAFQLTSLALFSMIAIRTSLYPKVALWWKGGERALIGTSLSKSFSFSLALAVPAATGAWVLGGPLLYFLYGSPFAVAGTAMAILFAVQIIVVFLTLETMCLLALDQPGPVFWCTVIGAVTTIALDFLLIPAYGIEGAALSLLFGTLFSSIAVHRRLAALIRVAVEARTILSIVGAAAIMACSVAVYRFLVPLTTVFLTIGAVAVGMIVYTVLLLGFDRTIREEVRELAHGVGIPWIG
ncbi:MAG TPA: polysaccharide biosynthesis C-terminal domain-containing protein [Methanoregulaceae archaeon]|nr:polysaccharide biosynthesis C-terminal domain-containing protein [Methanoregulaceae archaeon]